jgi:hypothetical protein
METERQQAQMHDLRDLMKIVDARYDNDARQLMKRNRELTQEVVSLENALRVSETQGHHMDSVARFFKE